MLTHTRHVKDLFYNQDAGYYVGEHRTDDRHHRDQAVPECMTHDYHPGRQPFGVSGADIIFTDNLQQASSGQAGDTGRHSRTQGDSWQEIVGETARPFKIEQAQLDHEKPDQQRPHDHVGDGYASDGQESSSVVQRSIVAQGGHGTQGDAHHHSDHGGQNTKLGRDGKGPRQYLADWPAPVLIRIAKIQAPQVLEVVEILLPDRLIQAILLLHILDHRLGQGFLGSAGEVKGPPGYGPHGEEGDSRNQQEDRDEPEKTPQGEK